MFLLIYLPSLGKYHLAEYTLFNLVISTIFNRCHKESIKELPQSSIVLKQDSVAIDRDKHKSWQCAIWGFRIRF